ncbi:hypothetical protein K440DRAFT_112749 [Wilcoxina mikolae CBS 423.85]|nr:hypothetical protein K440DRAFT_112749 [Wilcoxina mikolae CBS 423.85]
MILTCVTESSSLQPTIRFWPSGSWCWLVGVEGCELYWMGWMDRMTMPADFSIFQNIRRQRSIRTHSFDSTNPLSPSSHQRLLPLQAFFLPPSQPLPTTLHTHHHLHHHHFRYPTSLTPFPAPPLTPLANMRDMNCPEYLAWRSAKEEEHWLRDLEGTSHEMEVYDQETGWYYDIYGWFKTLEEELEYKRELDEKYGDIMKSEDVAEWEGATELWGDPEEAWEESESSEGELERELEQVQE